MKNQKEQKQASASQNDRWAAARRYMSGEMTFQEFRNQEPIYQTDIKSAMRNLAKKG
ncbi:MAG: hypothetical protein M3441_19555 [Chloroflexota bacterium]|nr:hypothetical protein [Chloroflexota bacterium]